VLANVRRELYGPVEPRPCCTAATEPRRAEVLELCFVIRANPDLAERNRAERDAVPLQKMNARGNGTEMSDSACRRHRTVLAQPEGEARQLAALARDPHQTRSSKSPGGVHLHQVRMQQRPALTCCKLNALVQIRVIEP
jgi:hypothetical protein